MRPLIFALLMINFSSFSFSAQQFTGRYEGKVAGIPLVFNISQDTTYRVMMSSPSQGAYDVPCANVKVEKNKISFSIPLAGASYYGTLNDNIITGHFIQGMMMPLKLKRVTAQPEVKNYAGEEVTFQGAAGRLAGTLLVPAGAETCIVMVTGSGAQNRDEEIAGHRPFAVIADSLFNHGIASLRYDDRGVGGSEPGNADATTHDFARDAMKAIEYARSRGFKKTGILGHSEGGTIAMICAAENPEDVDFIISLAGMTVPGEELMVAQNCTVMKNAGIEPSEKDIKLLKTLFHTIATYSGDDLAAELRPLMMQLPGMKSEAVEKQLAALTSPWYVAFVKLTPQNYLKKITCPVLALNGTNDYQVDCELNLKALRQLNRANIAIVPLEGLNHLFQQGVDDYSAPVPTPDPMAIREIITWLSKLK